MKIMNKVYIKAINYYLPEQILTNDQISERFLSGRLRKWQKKLVSLSAIFLLKMKLQLIWRIKQQKSYLQRIQR